MSLNTEDVLVDQRLAFGAGVATEKPAILIVDDEPQIVTAMTDALDEQYRVVGETSPQNALEILRKDHEIQVIISDQRMPVMTGDEFLLRAREISSATRILATAYADLSAVISAVNHGKIFHYIRKPWDEFELRGLVDTAAQHFALGAALQQERALLKCIMDCSIDAISVKDTNHRYIRLNDAKAIMLGANSPEDVNGRSHAEFLCTSRAALWSNEEDRLLETLEPVRDRIEHVVDDDGAEHWYATTKAPIREPSGAPIGLVSVTRDVTESKSIEQIKDDFISTARHELRTPLTVVASVIKLIRTGRFGTLASRIDELLIQSETNCDRLLRLINNMLDIQDIVVGRAALQIVAIPLRDLVEESRARNESLAKANEIDVQIGAISPDLIIVGDRERLTQLLSNLLSNACRFSPGRTAVNISVLEQRDQVRISVVDQGPGIPASFAEKLFKSFSQLDSSASRLHEGAGLGLRVCKAIAEAHGGRIGYMPAPSRGSNFFLVLPRDRSA
jgi:PAS domain S-box-containing protein